MSKYVVSEIIKKRRATPPRLFAKNELSKEVIEQLLESANWAPSHKKTEPWRFKVYTGKAKDELAEQTYSLLKTKLGEGFTISLDKVEKLKSTLKRVPVVIALVMQRDVGKRVPEWEEIAAVSMAVQNMWLHATEMNLVAFWATPSFVHLFDDILEIKPGQKCLGFFYVGQSIMDYPSPGRGDSNDKVEWK